jgi:predicted Zn-dependent peptidase
MLKGYTVENVREFYKANFGAARTHLYIVGRFSPDVTRSVRAVFESWNRGDEPKYDIPKPAAAKTLIIVDRPGAVQSTIRFGLPALNPKNPDYVAFTVMNALLGGSFNSRITANIREQKGYTYSPFSQLSTRYRDGFWVQNADVTTAVTGAALKEITYEIDRLRKEPPTPEELQGIKNYLAGTFVLQNSSRRGIVNQLVFVNLHELGEDYLKTFVQKVQAVTPADVQRMAETYLDTAKMTLAVAGDKSKIASQVEPFK